MVKRLGTRFMPKQVLHVMPCNMKTINYFCKTTYYYTNLIYYSIESQ